MLTVKPLFRGPDYQTAVWVSEDVLELLSEYLETGGDDAAEWVDKAEYYAKAGFHKHEGKSRGIRPKWGSILAIQPWATLFRLYGFYENASKKDFIVVSTTMKKGGKMRDKDREEVDYAALVCAQGAWQKDDTET